RAALSPASRTLNYLADVLRRHRTMIRSTRRLLGPTQPALPVMVHLHKGETYAEPTAGPGIGTITAWRYIREAVTPLAARCPKLDQALRATRRPPIPGPRAAR